MRIILALALLLACTQSNTARADFHEGVVPAGDNAYTVPRGHVRLSLLGASAVGLSHRIDLGTYLPLDFILFPNLRLRARIVESERVGVALQFGVGAGLYPIAGGFALPLPVPVVVGGGFVGLVPVSYQRAGINLSLRTSERVTLTARGSVVAVEAGVIAIGAGGAAGANGASAVVVPVTDGTSAWGGIFGFEADVVLSDHDAIVLDTDLFTFHGADSQLVLATVAWTHAWEHFHLSAGAYAAVDLPDARVFRNSKIPVSPYVNVYWTF